MCGKKYLSPFYRKKEERCSLIYLFLFLHCRLMNLYCPIILKNIAELVGFYNALFFKKDLLDM